MSTAELTPIQKLDETLRVIVSANKPPFRTEPQILSALPFQTDIKELHEILHKLEKDVMIYSEQQGYPFYEKGYFSTFEGRMLIQNKGYEEAAIKSEMRKRWEDSLMEKGRKDAEHINILTLWLAIGSIGLFLMEILKFLREIKVLKF